MPGTFNNKAATAATSKTTADRIIVKASGVEDASLIDTACFKRGMENSKKAEVAVAKSDDSHQEGKHDSVAQNLAKAVTTSDLLSASGVKIPSEDIDFTYTRVGGTKHHHPMGTIKYKEKEGGRRPWRT